MMLLHKGICLCVVLIVVDAFQPSCDGYNQFRFHCFPIEYCNKYDCFTNNCGRFLKNSGIVRVKDTKIIPKCAFSNSKALFYVSAVNSNVEVVASGSFVNLSNLDTINLSFNLIKQLHSGTFRNVSAKSLDLSWNKLVYIQETSFLGLYDLQHLNLSKNELSTIPIHKLPIFLTELNLSHNFFQRILLTSKRTPNLTDVDLSYNKLNKIALSFDIPMNRIDLTNNQLSTFDLLDIPSCEELKISLNQFSLVPEALTYLKIKAVSLYPNPWRCDELTNLWAQLQNNFANPETDHIPEQSEGTSPICVTSGETSVSVRDYYEDLRVCKTDEHCDENMICRNEKCLDPCKDNVCHPTSVCVTKNHKFDCFCPDNKRRDPKKVYSPCLNVECFSNRDCFFLGYCSSKQRCLSMSGVAHGFGEFDSNESSTTGDCGGPLIPTEEILHNTIDVDEEDEMWWRYDLEKISYVSKVSH